MAILRDLALDDDGDLLITNGDLAWVDGAAAVAQAISIRLKAFKGEWVFDENIGTPWLQSILVRFGQRNGQPITIAQVRQVIAQRIQETPGVAELTRLAVRLDRATRGLFVDATVTIETGAPASLSVVVPF